MQQHIGHIWKWWRVHKVFRGTVFTFITSWREVDPWCSFELVSFYSVLYLILNVKEKYVFLCVVVHFVKHIGNPPPPDKGKGTKNTAKVGVFRVVDTQDSSDITLSWVEEAVDLEPPVEPGHSAASGSRLSGLFNSCFNCSHTAVHFELLTPFKVLQGPKLSAS